MADGVAIVVGYRGVLLHRLRQMLEQQLRAGADQHGVLNDVLELADVARPGERLERGQRLGADIEQLLLKLAIEAGRHAASQGSDVLDALAQGRQVERHHVEAEIEIGAEPAALDGVFEVEVAGDDQAGRACLRLDAADRLELAGLDDAQQRRLLFQTERVDFVEQQRAVADGGELADLGTVGAR